MTRAIELLLADQANTKQDFKSDWKEDSKLDFILEEDLPTQVISVVEDGEPALIAQATPTNMYFGTGNKATHYLVAKNETQGLEIAVKLHARGAPGYAVTTGQNEDGYYEFEVPAQPLLTVPGVDPKRTRWNYSYSIATGLNEVDSSIGDFSFKLAIDFDPVDNPGQIESVLLSYGGNGKWVDIPSGRQIIDPDSGIDTKGGDRSLIEQNSFNIGIVKVNAFRPIDIDPLWAEKEGFYNFTLTAYMGGKVVLEHKVKVHTDPSFVWTL